MGPVRPFPNLVVACFLTVVLAGCVETSPLGGDPGGGVPTGNPFAPLVPEIPAFDFSRVVDPDHGAHEAARLHTAGHGLGLVGHTGVASILPPGVRGSITQIDVQDGYAVVAGMEGGPAFIIVDIRDPKNPKAVSYAPTVADGWTARWSNDGQYVFYGCQVLGPPYTPQGFLRGSCQDPGELHGQTSTPSGVSVWDLSDKRRPIFVDFVPTAGSHNIYAQNINGTDYVFTSAVTILKFDRETKTLTEIAKVPGTHDATVQRHPVTGEWLLYTGTKELAVYNVNDPANPVVVFEAGGWKAEDGRGWHDQVAFPYLVDGRALLALAGETGINTAGGTPDMITIVDVNDPAAPKKLSQWRPPFAGGKVPWNSYTFSVHEMAATPQGQLATSWYHGGVWVLDLSTQDRQASPAVLAAFQPSKDINVTPSNFAQTPIPLVPFAWSVAWDARGYVVVPDMHTGVYVLEPEWGLHPVLDNGA